MPVDELRVIEVKPGWAMGTLGNCLAVVWRDQPTPEAFRVRNEALLELAKSHPRDCVLVEVVETTSKAPSDDTRRVAMEVFRQVGQELTAIGFVIEGSHVRSSLTRAVLTGMMYFVKQLQPTKIFKHSTDATKWLRGHLHTSGPDFESRLDVALEQLRQRIPS